MITPLESDGFTIQPAIISSKQIELFRLEADRIVNETGTSCVRHLRKRSDLINKLSLSPLLLNLLPTSMIPVRSILFDKSQNENWAVTWHQDLTITVTKQKQIDGYGRWSLKDKLPHVQPPKKLLDNMVTIRLHLDDTPATNGALRVIPKSHLLGKIPTNEVTKHAQNNEVVCECLSGDILLMKPLLLHSSRRSSLPGKNRRRVIHLEYARKDDLHPSLKWAENSLCHPTSS
ncbi:MAG: phytanoyl-CoA dioxygenase family protein [Akkermansiaceae bacterium]